VERNGDQPVPFYHPTLHDRRVSQSRLSPSPRSVGRTTFFMASDVHVPSRRPAIVAHEPIARHHPFWLVPIVAIAVFGAACATPVPDVPLPAASAPAESDAVGTAGSEPDGGADARRASVASAGAAPSDAAPRSPGGPALPPSMLGGDEPPSEPQTEPDGHAAGARADAAELGPIPGATDGLAPSAPSIPGPPLVVPPVVVPPVPAPPGLIQAAEPPCEPGSGPRAGSWRDPLPQTPRHNPDGPKRVGLQAGHWLTEQVPAELRGLQHGATGGGKMEWEVNLDIARRTQALLEAQGVIVDILPTTVPVRYRAHLFVSIHADGDATGRGTGFKIARPAFSSLPTVDDRLVESLYAAYGTATGLRRDDEHITSRMRYYYAFNSRRFCHAVAPGVPQAIVETGFLTSAADRRLLLGTPDIVARGIADGILRFLRENP
jgi:hypothetical protein